MAKTRKHFLQSTLGMVLCLPAALAAIVGLFVATSGSESVHSNELNVAQVPQVQKAVDAPNKAEERVPEAPEQPLAQVTKPQLSDEQMQRLAHQLANPKIEPVNFTTGESAADSHGLTGDWLHDNAMGQYRFALEQRGNYLSLREFDAVGNLVGEGTGIVEGNQVYLAWIEPLGAHESITVEAQMIHQPDQKLLTGQMFSMGNAMPVRFTKQ